MLDSINIEYDYAYVSSVDKHQVSLEQDKFLNCPCVLCSFAFIEFSERDSVGTAMTLDNTLFRGRVIKVSRENLGIGSDSIC